MCCFYNCVGNRGNGYYSYEDIGNNFLVDCYSLNFYFVNCFVIYFDRNYHWVFDNLICCMNFFLICCFDNTDFDYLNSFYFYC